MPGLQQVRSLKTPSVKDISTPYIDINTKKQHSKTLFEHFVSLNGPSHHHPLAFIFQTFEYQIFQYYC